eukprot:366031-Chlamydomonas_euryale.AAC.16
MPSERVHTWDTVDGVGHCCWNVLCIQQRAFAPQVPLCHPHTVTTACRQDTAPPWIPGGVPDPASRPRYWLTYHHTRVLLTCMWPGSRCRETVSSLPATAHMHARRSSNYIRRPAC